MPRVSVGMPVLNAEATVGRALQDLVTQTYQDLEIVVCDNASDDGTAAIADVFAERDRRVRVLRFDNRVDILGSFRRAFEACAAPYFVFAPADDRWYPRAIELAVAVLEDRADLAACCPRIAMVHGGRYQHLTGGTRPLAGSHRQRLRCYFAAPAENARAFAVYRREALVGSFPDDWYPGWDFAMIAATLAYGEHAELPDVLMERDRTLPESYFAEFDRYFGPSWRRWLPWLPAAKAVWRHPKTPRDAGLLWNLFLFVLRSHEYYAAARTRRWGPFVSRMAKRLGFARWPICAPSRDPYAPTARSRGDMPSAERSRRISSR